MVFGVTVEDLHNTKNGELPGHVRFGEDHEPGATPWADAAKAEYEARVAYEAKLKAEKEKNAVPEPEAEEVVQTNTNNVAI